MEQVKKILENVIHITDNPNSDQFRENLGSSVREMIAMDEIAFVCPQISVDNQTTYALMYIDTALSRRSQTSLRELIGDGTAFLSPNAIAEILKEGHLLKKHGDSVIVFLPVMYKANLVEIIIVSAPSMPSEALFLLKGYVRLYRNFLSLIIEGQTDGLTGLLNRKAMESRLSIVVNEAQNRQNKPEWAETEKRLDTDALQGYMAVVDIDHFKKINDTKGHLFGDEVIILVARLLQEIFRSNDLIFRFGGEEFVVVLFAQDAQGAMAALDRFRQRMEEHQFPQLDKVTVSIGFVEIKKGENTSALIGQADQALYYAKEHGRNQCCDFDALLESGKLNLIDNKQDVELF